MAKLVALNLSHLLPHDDFLAAFTTCEVMDDPRIEKVFLDDNHLGVHKISSGTTHRVVHPPKTDNGEDIKTAWEAFYPKGSVNPKGEIPGGFGLYVSGPPSFAERLATASEATFGYRMMLQKDWEWPMVALVGGRTDVANASTYGPDGVGELYAYLPLTADNATQLSAVPPRSMPNSDYGFSVGRGAFRLDHAIGNWVTIAFRIKMNGVDSKDGKNDLIPPCPLTGEVEIWVDGNSVIKVEGLTIRTSDSGRIKGMHFQTFFGGCHGKDWASPKDQRAWFADVTGAILE
ncbi:hypothetical protein CVT26_005321 [Gymnopilus dilepis]|uniref:Polysaccharide lyase 14 domain-containing protein n=1 Tax=Gymnopilus dilepis TaxID=231916 RepID=A0A409WJD3_9AGAR|nr:hypothetical protein CVT26_005321 [Gymnopilus dilepis]